MLMDLWCERTASQMTVRGKPAGRRCVLTALKNEGNKKALKRRSVSRPAGKVANCDRLVPGAGIEPARCFHRQILSLLRLPISPPRRRLCIIADLPLKGNRNAVFQAFFVAKIVKCSTIGGRAKNGPTTLRHWVKAGEPRKSTV